MGQNKADSERLDDLCLRCRRRICGMHHSFNRLTNSSHETPAILLNASLELVERLVLLYLRRLRKRSSCTSSEEQAFTLFPALRFRLSIQHHSRLCGLNICIAEQLTTLYRHTVSAMTGHEANNLSAAEFKEYTQKVTAQMPSATGKDLQDQISNSSDNVSIASNRSDDSEIEPFEEYLPKIEQLLGDIRLGDFSVEVLQRGLSCRNCVYSLESLKNDEEQYILRVPVYPDLREDDGACIAIENDAAVLGYLADNFAVARVKAYSIYSENALDAPYTIQTKLSGQSLDHIYKDLTYEEKLRIIDQHVELLAKLESTTFSTAGTFTAPPTQNPGNDLSQTPTPIIEVFCEDDNEDDMADPLDKCDLEEHAGPDVKSFLSSHLRRLIDKEVRAGSHWVEDIVPSYRQLLIILDELETEGAFKDGPFPIVLHHWDLEPRNIMVENSSGVWRFCGVIDWDDTLALSRPLARRASDWIWELDGGPVYTGYPDNDHQPNEDLSEESSSLKAYFDAKAALCLPRYLEDAYGHGRWLRRIWTFARAGAADMWYMEMIKELIEDWEGRPRPSLPTVQSSNVLHPISSTGRLAGNATISANEEQRELQPVESTGPQLARSKP